jgi:MFS transporter, DHA3 family, macrolide efflux protein
MPQSASAPPTDDALTRRITRNIALVAGGAGVSTFGTGLYAVGTVLYITEHFNSPALVSAFNFLAFAPAALLARPIGNLVDRSSRKHLIVGSDLARGVLMIVFGLLVASLAHPSAVLLLGFGLLAGLGQAVFVPSVHAYMPDLVGQAHLPRANAVRAGSGQVSNAAGMASAGILISLIGLPLLLIANGVSFLISAIPEAALRPAAPEPDATAVRDDGSGHERGDTGGRGSAEGSGAGARGALRSAIAGDRRLLALTVVNTVMYGLSAPLVVTIPFMLRQSTDSGDVLTGLVFAAMVVGGLAGFAAASLAARRWGREGGMIRVALLGGAAALALVAVAPGPATLFTAAPLFGATAAVVHVGVITLVQRIAPAGGRGRVFAAIEAYGAAAAPVGYVVGGLLGSMLLGRLQIVYGTLAVVVALVFLATVRALRRT